MESNTVTTSEKPSLINLQLGWPSPRLFAASGLLGGATQVLASESETAATLIYGPHVGHPPLREIVAGWLSSVYGTNIDHEWISINKGASGNLANILLNFTDPLYTRKIFMFKAETEVQAITSFKKADQPDKPTLKVGRSYPKIFKYVIYLVPTFSNPSGKTLSLQMRKDLVLLAQRLVDIDRSIPGYSTWGNIVGNGSFSKVIGPGVRVGWADSAPAFATELAEVGRVSDRFNSSRQFIVHILFQFLSTALDGNFGDRLV
ncbi:pyridoxal phosphate-dependent transferase [Colletotrichum cereale]|nr:pyridoxal phosphate-dependent transferase [Colletotrichum cereale]